MTIGSAILGGVLVAGATMIHMYWKGRVTGFSGMIWNTMYAAPVGSLSWRAPLLLGTIGAGCALSIAGLPVTDTGEMDTLSAAGWAVGGLLVGLGTKLGNGCTSGHGLCGVPRASVRSVLFIGVSMVAAAATATANASLRLFEGPAGGDVSWALPSQLALGACVGGVALLAGRAFAKSGLHGAEETLGSAAIGVVFGAGLAISGMSRRSSVVNFLNLRNPNWSPDLLVVFATGVAINTIVYFSMIKPLPKPARNEKFELPTSTVIDWQLLTGAVLFGLGWGISGSCPGPALVTFPMATERTIFNYIGIAAGMITADKLATWVQQTDTTKKN
jgi:uncharacterized membrane protein YedE/YeeE